METRSHALRVAPREPRHASHATQAKEREQQRVSAEACTCEVKGRATRKDARWIQDPRLASRATQATPREPRHVSRAA